jgi:hypothetical protein
MGIFSFIRAMFDTKYSCDQFIKSAEISFHKHKKEFPGYEPHFYLTQAWLAYMAARGSNPYDQDLQLPAFTTTYLVACVPPPKCARALGLFLLYRERPEELEKYKDLQEEFNRIMQPVFEAQENGTIEQLYKKYNPKMAEERNKSMGNFDKFTKKPVSYETACEQLLSIVVSESEAFSNNVIPSISKDLNLDLSLYDKNTLRLETMFVCFWAAIKALEGDNEKLLKCFLTMFFEAFEDEKAKFKAIFKDRYYKYNEAWDDSSGGNQSILALNILAVMFCAGKPEERLLDFGVALSIQELVFKTMENILKVRKQIELKNP